MLSVTCSCSPTRLQPLRIGWGSVAVLEKLSPACGLASMLPVGPNPSPPKQLARSSPRQPRCPAVRCKPSNWSAAHAAPPSDWQGPGSVQQALGQLTWVPLRVKVIPVWPAMADTTPRGTPAASRTGPCSMCTSTYLQGDMARWNGQRVQAAQRQNQGMAAASCASGQQEPGSAACKCPEAEFQTLSAQARTQRPGPGAWQRP